MTFYSTAARFFVCSICLLSLAGASLALEPAWEYAVSNDDITDAAVSSDGSTIAVAAGKIVVFAKNGSVKEKLPYGEHLAMTPDGTKIASQYYSSIFLFQKDTSSSDSFTKKWEYSYPDRLRYIGISNDGKTIVTSGNGLFIYNLAGTLTGTSKKTSTLVRLGSKGSPILGVSQGGMRTYSKSGTSSKLYELSINQEPKFMVMPSSGSTFVIDEAQKLHCVIAKNGTDFWSVRATGTVSSLVITSDGTRLIAGTENGNIDCFDKNGTLQWSYPANPQNSALASVKGVALSSKGTVIAAGTYDGRILILDGGGSLTGSYQTKDHIQHIAMSSDGSVVVATGDETVYGFFLTAPSEKAAASKTTAEITTLPVDEVTNGPEITPGENPQEEPLETFDEPVAGSPSPSPTEYSVIRTASQSPVGIEICLVPLVLVILFRRMR